MRYVTLDRHGGPEVLRVAETETPKPQRGEVLIAVEAAGVSRADVLQRRGLYPPPAGASPTLGLDAAGTIAELGEAVTGLRVGESVCALLNGGGYAEFATAPQGQVLPIPEGWSAVEAATLPENAFTVFDNMVTRGRLRSGDVVLVHGGTSGIGSTAIMFARAFGARAIATAGSEEKCEACRRIGTFDAIDYKRSDFVAEALRLTQERGVDLVIDAAFGTGLSRAWDAPSVPDAVPVLAVDVPSGVDPDTGVASGHALRATRTVAMGALKRGHVLADGAVRIPSLRY